MTVFSNASFWLFFIAFFIAIFFAFYIPGSFFLKKYKLTSFPHIILSIITGMALWGWQGFIFGFLDVRWMSYFYLLVFLILWIRTDEKKKILNFIKKSKEKPFKKIDFPLAFIIILGTILQLISIFAIGIVSPTGMSFCCAVPDSLYHIALTNQLVKQFPPTEPGMAGIIVHNYHYMSNLVAADLIRIFHLPLIATLYQYFVVLLSLLLGLSAIAFGQIAQMKKTYIRWLVFFLYFSGDITYVLTFLNGKGFNFTIPTLENALWLWISPPRVFAAVVFFAGISLLYLWIKQKRMVLGILTAFVLASLVSFKIYDGIFMAAGVSALFIYFVVTKQFRMLIPLILTGILSLILYLPVNAASGGLVFTGGWRFENFIVQPGLNLIHFEMAREIYVSHHNWFGVARFELFFALMYLIFVFGTILLGIFQTKKSLSHFPRELNIFLLAGIGVSALFGFFFIQTSGGANSSQFLITIDIVGSIYAALACYYWIGKIKNKINYLVVLLIVILTIPRVFDIAHVDISQIGNDPSLKIDTNQLQALNYLKLNIPANAIILADNLERPPVYVYDPKTKKRIQIYVYDPRTWVGNFSYYISFLSNRSLFIDGDVATNSIVQSHGVDINARVNVDKTIFAEKNPALMNTVLHKDTINYIYLSSNAKLAKYPPKFLKTVFRNSEVSILKVL
jgi:hypothetical protein